MLALAQLCFCSNTTNPDKITRFSTLLTAARQFSVGLCSLWIGLQASGAGAQSFEATVNPTLNVQRVQGEIRIDGDLSDAGWQGATEARAFAEIRPGDLTEPPVDTRAWITYDQENLYVAIRAYDDPSSIRASLRDRDQIWSDDFVGIMLDTYASSAWCYEIFVNPLGIQGDLRLVSGAGEDMSFDVVFRSEGKVEILPSMTSKQFSGLRDSKDVTSGLDNGPIKGDAELGLRYTFNSSTTSELTLNPDFSQVEADAGQIDVNTTFALFFPERRPFFQEGSDIYNTWINAVYTRTINDPSVASKITRRTDNSSFGWVIARSCST